MKNVSEVDHDTDPCPRPLLPVLSRCAGLTLTANTFLRSVQGGRDLLRAGRALAPLPLRFARSSPKGSCLKRPAAIADAPAIRSAGGRRGLPRFSAKHGPPVPLQELSHRSKPSCHQTTNQSTPPARILATPFESPKFLFSSPSGSVTSLLLHNRRCLDGQKIKASGVDSGRCADLENRR